MVSTALFQRIHARIARERGRATDYTCFCGLRAAEWALIGHRSDYPVPAPNRRGYRHVNDDPRAYQAMCLACHKLHDRDSHEVQVERYEFADAFSMFVRGQITPSEFRARIAA
jgi:hypothetical protein